jgi:hypothetical protein
MLALPKLPLKTRRIICKPVGVHLKMKTKITIETDSLKDFLALFDIDEKIIDLELGDTWHAKSGFVDETILEGNHKIIDIIEFDYDFNGLVFFKGKLNSFHLRLMEVNNNMNTVKFEVNSSEKEIRILKNKIIEQNAYHPKKYKLLN